MAMILRLHREKSTVEIQVKQFQRVVEQKQDYDLEVIKSLHDVGHIGNCDEDVDNGSGFLNFSVEYNDLDVASSQNHSPSHTPQYLVVGGLSIGTSW
ncbi:hypothetical protein VNO80_02570 [Phaseolus coccineus]|uniref:GTD-binding domain-containing protein n=1 Tax=Phaseolus coccineus TaxID=3886 RepID=A0AAN9RI29_PHACN